MPPSRCHRLLSVRTGAGSSSASSHQAEPSYEERVARVCALGGRVHQAFLLQQQQQLTSASGSNGNADSSGGGSGGSSSSSHAGAAAATAAATARGSGGKGGGSSRRAASGGGARAAAAAGGGGGGAPMPLPRAAELAAAADDLAVIREVVSSDPSHTTPDIFTEARLCGQLQGLMALLGWCLRLAVPAQPPFVTLGGGGSSNSSTTTGGTASGSAAAGAAATHGGRGSSSISGGAAAVGSNSGSSSSGRGSTGVAAASSGVAVPTSAQTATAALGTDNDDLRAAAFRTMGLLSGALFDCGRHGWLDSSWRRRVSSNGDGGDRQPTAADRAQLAMLLVRCGCFDVMCAALTRCCRALEPALPPPPPTPPPAAAQQQQQQQHQAQQRQRQGLPPAVTQPPPPQPPPPQPLPLPATMQQRRVRLGNAGWAMVWPWLDFAHDLLNCADGCVASRNDLLNDALRSSLPTPSLRLKLLDCYSRTLLAASAAVAGAGGGGSGGGGGGGGSAQQAGALARALGYYAQRMTGRTLVLPYVAACPALSYALAAHAVHTCAAVDGGDTYGLRCGPVAAAVARAVAPPGGTRSGTSSAGLAARIHAAADAGSGGGSSGPGPDDDDDDQERGGAGTCCGVVLPLQGPGNRLLQPPDQCQQQQLKRRHGGGGGGGSGGGSNSSTRSSVVPAAIGVARPAQAAVNINAALAHRAAEVWRDALSDGWQWLLEHPPPVGRRLSPQEQLQLCRTQPGCLRAAYARALGLAEGQPQQLQVQLSSVAAGERGSSHGAPCSAAAAAEELSRRLAAARSCPLLHCGGAFEVGMRLAAAAAGCMAHAPATAEEHAQQLLGVQQLALAAVVGRRSTAATAPSAAPGATTAPGVPAAAAASAGGEGGSQAQADTEEGRQRGLPPPQSWRLELAGVACIEFATAGLKLARAAWLDTSAVWMPRGAFAHQDSDGSSTCSGGSSSSTGGSSTAGGGRGHGGVPYPPAPVQRDLLSWWRAALGWAGLLDMDWGGTDGGGGAGGGGGDEVSSGGGDLERRIRLIGPLAVEREAGRATASEARFPEWRLDVPSGSPTGVAEEGGVAPGEAVRMSLPPLRLRPCPDVAAALAAGYLPVLGRLLRKSAVLDSICLMEPHTHSSQVETAAATAAAWSQLLVFGPPEEARAFVAEAAGVIGVREDILREAVAEEMQAAARQRRQAEQEQKTEQQQGRQTAGRRGAGSGAVVAAGASAGAAAVASCNLSLGMSLVWESLDLCENAGTWSHTGGLAQALLTSGLLLASGACGSSSAISGSSTSASTCTSSGCSSTTTTSTSGSSSTPGPSSSPLAGLQLGNEAAVAARVAAVARVVATQLLPAASEAVATLAAFLEMSHMFGLEVVLSTASSGMAGAMTPLASLLGWVPLMLRAAAAEGEEEQQQQQQQQQQHGNEAEWERGGRREECGCCWERVLWRDINLPALLAALYGLIRRVRNNSHDTAAATGDTGAAAGGLSKRAIEERSYWRRARDQVASTLLPEMARVMISVLQLAPLRLLQPAAPPGRPPQPSLPPPVQQPAAAAGAASGERGPEGAVKDASEAAGEAVNECRGSPAPTAAVVAAAGALVPAGPLESEGCCGSDAAAPALLPTPADTPAPAAVTQTFSGSSTSNACNSSSHGSSSSSHGSSSSSAAACQPAAGVAAVAARLLQLTERLLPTQTSREAVIDVGCICELLRAWGGDGDGPAMSTHLAGVLESAAAGDWAAVRAKSRWLRFGGVVTHAPSDVAAQLWRQQRQVMAHGAGHGGVPLEASVLDGALDAAAALLVGQGLQQQQQRA